MPMAKQDDTAMETAEVPPTEEETEQPASGADAPKTGQSAHASLAWDLSSPPPPESMGNPALAGLPPKPRCSHCGTLLADGQCVEPDCRKDQDVEEK